METRCPRCGHGFDSQVAPGLKAACPRCLVGFLVAPADDPQPNPLSPGETFRDLEVIEEIGRGGMGVVYKARQMGLNRMVALKILTPRLAGDPDFAQRFGQEAQALAALNHPNIVQVYEFGKEGSVFFLAMEYVDGVSLRDLMRERRLAPAEALKIVPQICEALGGAHLKGVIHRDIKPENILIDRVA